MGATHFLYLFVAGALVPVGQQPTESLTTLGEAGTTETQQPFEMQICRPTIACMAEIVPAGHTEVEIGYLGRSANSALAHTGQLLLKVSVLDWLQLQVATNNFVVADVAGTRGMDGLGIGAKMYVVEQGRYTPSFGFSLHTFLPTSRDPNAVQQSIDGQLWLYVSKDISRFHADINLAGFLYGFSNALIAQGLATLAVSMDIYGGLGVMTETYTLIGRSDRTPQDGGWLTALSYSPHENVMFDAGIDVGFQPATRALSFFFGVSVLPYRRSNEPRTTQTITPPPQRIVQAQAPSQLPR